MSLMLSLTSLVTALSMAATEPVTAVAPPAADKPKSKLICKSFKITGTRLARDQVCMTKAQWDFETDQVNRDHRNSLGKGNKIPAR